MITYKEMAEPAKGWRLERVRNVRAYGGGAYWEVVLRHKYDGTTIEYSDNDLEKAFTFAVRAAENYNARGEEHRLRREA